MAKNDKKASPAKNNRGIRDNMEKMRKILGGMRLNIYGTDRKSQADSIVNSFDKVIAADSLNEVDLTGSNKTLSSFVSDLFNLGTNKDASSPIFSKLDDISANTVSTMTAYLEEAYHNKKFKQMDIQECCVNLVELKEAVSITTDAILSPDLVSGRMQRNLNVQQTDEEADNVRNLIESMEDRLNLEKAIREFIVPNTLQYGEYYVYNIPYSVMFAKFMKQKQNSLSIGGGINSIIESTDITLLESVENMDKATNDELITEAARHPGPSKPGGIQKVDFIQDTYKIYSEACKSHEHLGISQEVFTNDMKAVLGNIIINNEAIPLPVCEEGVDSIEEYMTEFVTESGDREYTEAELESRKLANGSNLFTDLTNSANPAEAIYGADHSVPNSKSGNVRFDIKDVYIKYLDPIKVIPVKLMSKTIGYYYIIEDKTSIPNTTSNRFTNAVYSDPFNPSKDEHTIIAAIADRIVKSFDKKFLNKNMAFREIIAEAIQYINITDKRIRFQYIPVEYMAEFKIGVDEEGNGTSMLDNAISYARLYFTLLMFKIMTIILYSNDTRVNYVKTSPLDKDVTGKIQRIIRKKQSRTVNIRDLWSFTTVANKVGQGSEMYVPVGQSGEKALETEILSGQDVNLHSDLLETLRNQYILATGVPAAIINYLSEADFAKVVEQNNAKFMGRCVRYGMDLNKYITEWYKMLMRWSTNIPERDIATFEFQIPPPKTTNYNITNELIQSFDQKKEFLAKMIFGDDYQQNPSYKEFSKMLAKQDLPNIPWDDLEKFKEQSEINAAEDKLKAPEGGSTDDIGLDTSNLSL